MKRFLLASVATLAIQAPVHALIGIGVSGGLNTTSIDAADQTISGGDVPKYFGNNTPSLTLHREKMSSMYQLGVKAWLEIPLLPIEIEAASNLGWGNYKADLKYKDATRPDGISIPVDVPSPLAGFGEDKGATPYVSLLTDVSLRYPVLKLPPLSPLKPLKIYVGAGATYAMASRVIDKKDIEKTFSSASGSFDPNAPEKSKSVIEDELFQSTFGGHVLVGAQFKVPILPIALFIDGKWYFHTAVSDAASGYPLTVNAGIGFAL